jgi:hypothetical protein
LKGKGNFLQDKKFPLTYRLLLFILKKGAGGTFFDGVRCGNVPHQIRRSI